MNYEFGDIIDARNAPKPLGHFIVVLGETTNKEIMYVLVTSRVYAVFKEILNFFNDCISTGYPPFLNRFNKEKRKQLINPHGRLADTLFLDKETHYNLCLDTDSMIVLNRDPVLLDKIALENLRDNKMAVYRDKLSKIDLHRLITMIRYSGNISQDKEQQIEKSFATLNI